MWIKNMILQKRRFRAYQARKEQFPSDYRGAINAVEHYIYLFASSDGENILRMLDDLADLFEQGVANNTPLKELVGENPNEFVEVFLNNYPQGQWLTKERNRLNREIRAHSERGAAND